MLHQELKTRQTISAAQQQALYLLACNLEQLQQYVQEELLQNPLLELPETLHHHLPAAPYLPGAPAEDIPDLSADRLREHLLAQIPYHKLQQAEIHILKRLVDMVDRHTGYLPEGAPELSDLLGCPLPALERCLALLRGMEPAGIAAQDSAACLCAQLQARGQLSPMLERVVREHLADIAAGRLQRIADALKISVAQVRRAVEQIRACEPYPVRGMSGGGSVYVVPDIVFYEDESGWQVALQHTAYSRVRLSALYTEYRADMQEQADKTYLSQAYLRAQAMVRALALRENSLLRMAELLLKRQFACIAQGESPGALLLGDAAQELGLHISTVSRIVKDKYMQTPHGVYPLRHCFCGALHKSEAGFSSAQLRGRMAQLIAAENKARPLSDMRIASLLAAEGWQVSRRTIAKYRAALHIPNSTRRK
ncbi:MAG: RNA polymerase factor sigma-54 [Christensenellaceae bacterium]|nr:RNA polymerase factor sigma-54 [Christensenellaceae bacterium]